MRPKNREKPPRVKKITSSAYSAAEEAPEQAMKVEEYLKSSQIRFAFVDAARVVFDPYCRVLCERNACGYYGKCWVCPPDAGPIGGLIEKTKAYRRVLVFQSVHPIEDAFDIESMHEAGVRHNRIVRAVRELAQTEYRESFALGSGACGVCPVCAKREGKPCRFPLQAVVSLEACGVNVSALAKTAGLDCSNGENTVTFFGAVFFNA